MGVTLACERESAAPAPSPPKAGPEAPAPAPATPPAATAPVPEPATPSPAPEPAVTAAAEPATPSPAPAAGDPAQVERVLAEYHRIERLLRPRPEDDAAFDELSKADRKLLRAFLGEKRLTWLETDGSSDTIRQAWLEQLSKQAATEPPSTIRMPLYPNVGWGCEVPSEWVATGNFNPDCTFILPVGDTTLVDRCMECFAQEDDRRDTCISQRCSLQVQGHFTGKTTKPTAHCEGIGHEFHIERATAEGIQPTPFFLALPGGSPPPDGPPITDGPRFGVLFAGAYRHEKDARTRSDALQVRLVGKGHATAHVLDSRRISTLWCCSFAVLVERFDDEKAAKALAKQLKREGFDGALVRTLY